MPFNPTRLSIARKRRMLTKKGFAELASVAEHTIGRCENGETEPTPENVEVFAKVLGYPKEFFFLPDIDVPDTASFRSYTTMSAKTRDAALAAGAIGFMISDWVEHRFDLPPIRIPNLHLYEPEEAARALRQEWGLGEKPISNMLHLLESKGIRVFSLAENTKKVNAYALWRNGKPYIFLNTYKSAESSRFDGAHELCHLVMHQDNGVIGRQAEDQANLFASALLMPKADILAILPVVHSLEQLIRTKARWRVSVSALNYRLHKLGITSDWKYRDFCIQIAKHGYNTCEPAGIERERSVVWEKVLKALWAERTTQTDIARMLSVPESEVNDLIFGVIHGGGVRRPDQSRKLSLINQGDA
jgi:Zn-dependent peptidase ImmA (M78 family)/DNA-binding XRE family transcriptional regulator